MAKHVAGVAAVADLASALTVRAEEASIIADLRAGSEDAYSWLVNHYHQPVYSLVYRILNDPSDAADTTQEVFLKVFRGIKRFNGDASLKTWIYRIAIHEASNQRRWWFRHKRKETSMESPLDNAADADGRGLSLEDTIEDTHDTPFEHMMHEEVRSKVEEELKKVPEPYRTAVMLRDIEGLSYEEIAEILQVNLGTVKSRLMRGRDALRKRLEAYARQVGPEIGLLEQKEKKRNQKSRAEVSTEQAGKEVEVEAP